MFSFFTPRCCFQPHLRHPFNHPNSTGNPSRRGQGLDRSLRPQNFAGLRSGGGRSSLRQVIEDRRDRQRCSDHARIRNEASGKCTSDLKVFKLTKKTKSTLKAFLSHEEKSLNSWSFFYTTAQKLSTSINYTVVKLSLITNDSCYKNKLSNNSFQIYFSFPAHQHPETV